MKLENADTSFSDAGVIELIRYELPADLADSFPGVYKKVSKHVHASPHCRSVRLLRCVEEPGRFAVEIVGGSIDGYEEGFTNSPDFQSFIEPMKPYLPHVREMLHYSDIELA